MFAHITTISDYLHAVESKPEIRNIQIDEFEDQVMISSYIIADQSTFDNAFALEARGLTFVNDKIACRPLHKFFNVNELERTQCHLLPWHTVTRVMLKEDGSIVNPVLVDKVFVMKSKKSFKSDTAKRATAYLHQHENLVEFVAYCYSKGLTPTLEFIDTHNQIVVTYSADNMILTHIRENETGRYLTSAEIHTIAKWFDIEVVKELDVSTFNIQEYIELAKTLEGIEGWVIQFANGDMVKLKTEWYRARHHVLTFLRERDIAELAINEQLDDLKSVLIARHVDLAEVLAIEHQVCSELATLVDSIEQEVSYIKKATQDMTDHQVYLTVQALELKESFVPIQKLKSLIMARIKDKDVDYSKVYSQYRLKDFSLKQLNNLMQADLETE